MPEGGELQEEQEIKGSTEEEKEIQVKDYEDKDEEDEEDEDEEENNEVQSKVINLTSKPASLSVSSHCPPGYGPNASDPEECTGKKTPFLLKCFLLSECGGGRNGKMIRYYSSYS